MKRVTDEFSFERATVEDEKEVEQFLLDHFMLDEPMGGATQITVEQFLPCVKNALQRSLNGPFSMITRWKETGQVVGVLLQSVWQRPSGKPEDDYCFPAPPNSAVYAIGTILNELHNSFWNLVPDEVNVVLHREMSSVDKIFSRRGVASAMALLSLPAEELSKYRIDGLVSETSSLANQTLLKKIGYKTLEEIFFSEVRDENGEQLILPSDGTTKIVLNWLPLKR